MIVKIDGAMYKIENGDGILYIHLFCSTCGKYYWMDNDDRFCLNGHEYSPTLWGI